ncbi:MAG TPA: hypothetical protein VMF89_33600, partial [Polyangiales bacterium]|nr:hypothetical protein [Polyangiales bacterium]
MVASRSLERRHAHIPGSLWLLLGCVLSLVAPPRPVQAQLLDPPESRDPADIRRQEAEDAPRVSVVTFGVGDAVHQYFGHNALVIEGATVPEPTVFN